MTGINSRFAEVTEEEMSQTLTFLEYDVLSPSFYMLIQLFFSISMNSGFKNIRLHASHVHEYYSPQF